MIGVVLVLASLLSVGGQLCQKQATRPLPDVESEFCLGHAGGLENLA